MNSEKSIRQEDLQEVLRAASNLASKEKYGEALAICDRLISAEATAALIGKIQARFRSR